MRNGNEKQQLFEKWSKVVLTVPMRNGNKPSEAYHLAKKIVLTVPMRNGNVNNADRSTEVVEGSYRTYEEWKPSLNRLKS